MKRPFGLLFVVAGVIVLLAGCATATTLVAAPTPPTVSVASTPRTSRVAEVVALAGERAEGLGPAFWVGALEPRHSEPRIAAADEGLGDFAMRGRR